jgi:hypothetical protein
MGELSSKSDWFDAETGETHEVRTVHQLFDRCANRLRPMLEFPIWARNIVTGGSARYDKIGFSVGAREWIESGGELRQEGVKNVVYSLIDGQSH